MTDKSAARRVDVAPFEPPSPNSQTVSAKAQKKWSYAAALFIAVISISAIFKLFDLLGSNAEIQLVAGSGSPPGAEEQLAAEVQPALVESPFEDALLVEARSDSQAVLADLLPLRRSLEQRRAEEWAADSYSQMLMLAVTGDELYQSRDFETALLRYREALTIAENINAQAIGIAESLRTEAFAALQQRDAALAVDKFELAVAIQADNESGVSGLQRALALPEILTLIDAADSLEQQDLLEDAKLKLEEAVVLDAEDLIARERLVQIEQSISRRNFQQYMSLGYQELSSGNYQEAQNAFRSAQSLEPGNAAVSDALDQVEATRESDRSATLLQQARFAEQSEQWDIAQARYRQLLDEDPNRVEARIALVKVEARLNLENQMLEYIEHPLRLKDDQVWRDAEQTLSQARGISTAGPKLAHQSSQLAETIRKARTPVRLEVISDGATQVSILGVSNLGLIRNHPLDLNPGNYVLVGKKTGFQDIRQEIVLTGDEAEVTVNVVPSRSLESL
jgi:tetratricopeptide (TPR) repeat protein